MSDRPDYTLPVSIEAITITTLPVDITAQTIGNIGVNITTQTLADIRIEFHAQTMAVKLVPDWGAVEATDIDTTSYDETVLNNTITTITSYTVPVGKTLLIYDWSASVGSADIGFWAILDIFLGSVLSVGGGMRAFQTPLSKPKRVAAGNVARIRVYQSSGVNQSFWGHFGGILI